VSPRDFSANLGSEQCSLLEDFFQPCNTVMIYVELDGTGGGGRMTAWKILQYLFYTKGTSCEVLREGVG